MRETVTLTGVVLFAQPVGEYDRRLVILSRERGKITAFARGARRPKSPLLLTGSPFVFATFQLFEGRDAYTLISAEAADYMTELAQRMPGVFYGYYFLELADYYGREGLEAAGAVNLLYAALRALIREQMPPELIRRVYEIRMLVENGDYAPPSGRENIPEGAIYALRYVASSPVTRLFAFSLTEEAMKAFAAEADKAVSRAVDKSFKSLAVIADLV